MYQYVSKFKWASNSSWAYGFLWSFPHSPILVPFGWQLGGEQPLDGRASYRRWNRSWCEWCSKACKEIPLQLLREAIFCYIGINDCHKHSDAKDGEVSRLQQWDFNSSRPSVSRFPYLVAFGSFQIPCADYHLPGGQKRQSELSDQLQGLRSFYRGRGYS